MEAYKRPVRSDDAAALSPPAQGSDLMC